MIILALDTCLGACSVAVVEDGRVLAAASEAMTRGHQERLATMTGELMDRAGVGFGALAQVAVTIGPGSFTGLRVGLAFAKGLTLALRRPCVGVGTLEALAASAGQPGLVIAAIGAGRGGVYVQVFEEGVALTTPDVFPVETAAARFAELTDGRETMLVGPGAGLLRGLLPDARVYCLAAPSPQIVARLAAVAPATAPRPLYLRPPDARPKGP